ncbi:hypothetical protein [Natrialba swarupiae]|uniref:Uncharacterized protein n=1 Tax=Natrialba swarupiae TaxID=2448032 RepID=A0A5D5AQ62_9EURY|nr:hypothetical protein [Natrialba swarupiae]TYT63184.1 hypothetical protein FYC77_03680 [Natrialba swarupiae]
MRALRRCDFCGADAVGTFEIVPPELEPSEDEQRRVVLCTDCRNRLETLLEPLLVYAGATQNGGEARNERNGGEVGSNSRDGIVLERDDETGSNVNEPEGDSGGSAGGERSVESTSEANDRDEGPSPNATESGERPSPNATESGERPSPDAAESDEREPTSTTASSESAANVAQAATGGSDERARPPQGYAKAIRLLRNREFPMEREAVETLIAGAYDLESHETAEIVDHALENDEFLERGETLHRS